MEEIILTKKVPNEWQDYYVGVMLMNGKVVFGWKDKYAIDLPVGMLLGRIMLMMHRYKMKEFKVTIEKEFTESRQVQTFKITNL